MPGGSKNTGYAILAIRLILGVIFTAHGAQSLFGVFDGRGVKGTVDYMDKLGLVPPVVLGWAYCIILFFGGLFLIFGIFPRAISFLQALFILLILWKENISSGFFISQDASAAEFPLILLAGCFCLILAGAGSLASYDKY